MNLLESKFAAMKTSGDKGFVPYVTAGDPNLEDLPEIIRALEEAGADAIEIGVPFSDPIADGPVIQASTQRALDRGVTPAAILGVLSNVQCSVPLILMGYANTAHRWGWQSFAENCRRVEVAGVILSDLTPEESGEWKAACEANDLSTIFLVAPTSNDDRMRVVAQKSTGFVYAVSRTGVTGTAASVPEEVRRLTSRIRQFTDLPIAVGFGVSTPEQARQIVEAADAVIVGTHIVDWLGKNWNDGQGREDFVAHIRAFKDACRGTAVNHQ
ncbi:MAG: Tryptophan synthase alpha chain [Fimbriimonadaceae bacterium]|nr:Tryptophan synthase alpha chain [Fimbriimonadaceae bacterium]